MQKRYCSDILDLDARNCKGIRAIHLIHLSVLANPLSWHMCSMAVEKSQRYAQKRSYVYGWRFPHHSHTAEQSIPIVLALFLLSITHTMAFQTI